MPHFHPPVSSATGLDHTKEKGGKNFLFMCSKATGGRAMSPNRNNNSLLGTNVDIWRVHRWVREKRGGREGAKAPRVPLRVPAVLHDNSP